MKKIRVLVVDDSVLMRRLLGDIIARQPDMELVGDAANGLEALFRIEAEEPDVVTLDLEMPQMDGFDTLQKIMRRRPMPVIIVSSHTKTGSEATLKALSAGALDFIPKPAGAFSEEAAGELCYLLPLKIRAAYSVKPELIARSAEAAPDLKKTELLKDKRRLRTIVAVGASTGGPKALETLFCAWPAGLPAAVLLSLHMPSGFTFSFANRLNTLSVLRVKEGAEGDLVSAGCALVAPGGYHMKLKQSAIYLDSGPKVNFVRPSIDVMLDSLADSEYKVIVVILTGMGKDGADGAARLISRKSDTKILVQDPATALIPSMPEAAIKAATVSKVLLLDKMAAEIARHALN